MFFGVRSFSKTIIEHSGFLAGYAVTRKYIYSNQKRLRTTGQHNMFPSEHSTMSCPAEHSPGLTSVSHTSQAVDKFWVCLSSGHPCHGSWKQHTHRDCHYNQSEHCLHLLHWWSSLTMKIKPHNVTQRPHCKVCPDRHTHTFIKTIENIKFASLPSNVTKTVGLLLV